MIAEVYTTCFNETQSRFESLKRKMDGKPEQTSTKSISAFRLDSVSRFLL